MAQYAQQYGFATGALIGTRTDVVGATPTRFGTLQDVQVDFSRDIKQLFGQRTFAVAQGMGKSKCEIKAKAGEVSGLLYNNLYFGMTTTATATLFAENEAGAIPASSPYVVSVSNSANWKTDQGVYFAASGVRMTWVASAPATGQYSVAAGVYTFAAADTGKAVYISYTYSSTSGIQIPVTNTMMGAAPFFSLVLGDSFDTKGLTMTFPVCQSSKLSMPFKQDDFLITEMDIMVSADIAGNICTINMAQ